MSLLTSLFETGHEKTYILQTTKGAYQLYKLICNILFRSLDSTLPLVSMPGISHLLQAFEGEQTHLCLTCSKNLKTGILTLRTNLLNLA